MSSFTNPNLIDHIIRQQGGQECFEPESHIALQAHIEFETRRLIENAAKFMRCDKRDTISMEDLELAVAHLGHTDIILPQEPVTYKEQNAQAVRQDRIYASPEELFKEELKVLGVLQFDSPKLKGSWIYIKGKIPTTNQNIKLKSLSQMRSNKAHEKEEKKKLFNIIKDQPVSLLSREQIQYYNKITQLISANANLSQVLIQGNILSMVPFFFKFFHNLELNEAAITYLLKMLENRHVWENIEFYLKPCLSLLMGYKGPQSFDVGMKIAEIVKQFSQKYSVLHDIYEGYNDNSYSTVIKKIAFELVVGVPVQITQDYLSKCKQEAEYNSKMAIICMRCVLTYWSRIQCLKNMLKKRQGTSIYWHPSIEMTGDEYMSLY